MARKPRFNKRILRSGLEDKVAADLKERGIAYVYEGIKLKYVKECCPHCGESVSVCTYTPDFIIERHDRIRLIVESKGYFPSSDRTKMQRVKRDNPQEDIRILFQRDQPIRKGSKTTYRTWSLNNGFDCAFGSSIPNEWILGEDTKTPQQQGKTTDTKRKDRATSRKNSTKTANTTLD
jgi:hypothetical protein